MFPFIVGGGLLLYAHVLALVGRASAGSTELPLYREATDVSIAKGYTNKLYYTTVYIGTPPAPFKLCIDTGSSDTWLASSKCKSAGCSTLAKFDSRLSTSYVQSSVSGLVSITYGTGDVSGYAATETFIMGTPPITITKQAFGNMVELSEDFYQAPCDGLMGLAMPALSDLDGPPIFFTMKQEGLLTEPLFAVWLSANPANVPAGVITFGAVNPAHYTGPITYVPVTSKNFWKVAVNGARVGNTDINLETDAAITDTGGEGILMGEADAVRIHQGIPGVVYEEQKGIFNITGGCDNLASLPSIAFKLGGQVFTLAPGFWVQKVTIDEVGRIRPQAAVTPDDTASVQWGCVSSIYPIGGDAFGFSVKTRTMILGTPFLRAYYTVYRTDGPGQASLGFAASN